MIKRSAAKQMLPLRGEDDPVFKFLQQLKEKLLPGETAFLEIEGMDTNPITFEISHLEN
jgi:hypothetical protein